MRTNRSTVKHCVVSVVHGLTLCQNQNKAVHTTKRPPLHDSRLVIMPWFVPHVPERVCKYLLQRYLGQFFEEKLTLDQLSVDFYNGKGTVEKVSLDVQVRPGYFFLCRFFFFFFCNRVSIIGIDNELYSNFVEVEREVKRVVVVVCWFAGARVNRNQLIKVGESLLDHCGTKRGFQLKDGIFFYYRTTFYEIPWRKYFEQYWFLPKKGKQF